jgi:hypothetical protein
MITNRTADSISRGNGAHPKEGKKMLLEAAAMLE